MKGNISQQLLILQPILWATLLTGIVGPEREKEDKPAGLRTKMMVVGATCFPMNIISILIGFYHGVISQNSIRTGPRAADTSY